MRIKYLKDHSRNKAGDVVDVPCLDDNLFIKTGVAEYLIRIGVAEKVEDEPTKELNKVVTLLNG